MDICSCLGALAALLEGSNHSRQAFFWKHKEIVTAAVIRYGLLSTTATAPLRIATSIARHIIVSSLAILNINSMTPRCSTWSSCQRESAGGICAVGPA